MSSSTPSRSDSHPAPTDPPPIRCAPESSFDTIYETIAGRNAPPLSTSRTKYARPFAGPTYRKTVGNSSDSEDPEAALASEIPVDHVVNETIPDPEVAEHPAAEVPRERRKKYQRKPKESIGITTKSALARDDVVDEMNEEPTISKQPEAVVPASNPSIDSRKQQKKNKGPKCDNCGYPVNTSANGVHRCPIDEEDLFPVNPSSRCAEVRVETHVRGTAIPEKSPNGPVIPLNAPPTPAGARPTRIDADPTPYRPMPSTAPPPRASAQSSSETASDTRGNGESTSSSSSSDSAPSASERALLSPSSGSETGEEAGGNEPTETGVHGSESSDSEDLEAASQEPTSVNEIPVDHVVNEMFHEPVVAEHPVAEVSLERPERRKKYERKPKESIETTTKTVVSRDDVVDEMDEEPTTGQPEVVVRARNPLTTSRKQNKRNKGPKCDNCGYPVNTAANGVHRCPIDEEDLFPVDPSSRCAEVRVETHVRGTAIPEKSPNGPVIPLNAPPTPAGCRPTRIEADPTPYRPMPSTAPHPQASAQSVPETAPDTRGNGQSTSSNSDSAPFAPERALVSPSASDCNVPSGSQTGEEAKEPTQGAVRLNSSIRPTDRF